MITYRHTKILCKLVPESDVLTYKYTFVPDWRPKPRHPPSPVSLVALDTFVAAQRLVLSSPPATKVACLNFADDSFPTGCADTGSGAQEESLCYRSTLSRHISIRHYPLTRDVLLYSPGVLVFKATEEEGFQLLPRPFSVDVISCPGVRHPCLERESGRMTVADTQILRVKIETILQAAYLERVDHLVLGALGCGAWRNPPHEVATAFRDVLERLPGGLFKSVVFAIMPSPPSHNRLADGGCFATFQGVLLSTAPDQTSTLGA